MVDGTSWAQARLPSTAPILGAMGINALEKGGEAKRRERSKELGEAAVDAWKKGDREGTQQNITQLATIDPDAAKKVFDLVGRVDRTNFVESAFHLYSSGYLAKDEGAQNMSLKKAHDVMGGENAGAFGQGMGELLKTPFGKQRNEGIFTYLNIAKHMGAFGEERKASSSDPYAREKLALAKDKYQVERDREDRLGDKQTEEFEIIKNNLARGEQMDHFFWNPDKKRFDMVAGSPTMEKRLKDRDSTINKAKTIKLDAERVLRTIELASKNVSWKTTGFFGKIAAMFPGSKATDLGALSTEIRSLSGFTRIQEMKSQSTQGATGLGQVAVPEFEALQASFGNLDTAQSEDQFMTRLLEVQKAFKTYLVASETAIKRLENTDINDFFRGSTDAPQKNAVGTQYNRQNPARTKTDEDIDQLNSGDVYVDERDPTYPDGKPKFFQRL